MNAFLQVEPEENRKTISPHCRPMAMGQREGWVQRVFEGGRSRLRQGLIPVTLAVGREDSFLSKVSFCEIAYRKPSTSGVVIYSR